MVLIMNSKQMIEQLVGFNTVSRDSNLSLIEFVQNYLNDHGVASTRVVSDDGEKMCSVDEKTVRLWKSLGEGRPGDEWQAALAEPLAGDVAHGETIRRCAFEPGKWGTHTRLITAGEHELFFWAAKDLETYETAVTHRDYVESLDWTADGRLFASAGDRRRPAAATNSERFRPGKR